MKVLVTGAAGQVGKALLASAPEGWDVEGLTRADCDLSDEGALETLLRAKRPDLVINAAAYTAVDQAENESDLAYAINRDAVWVIASQLAETGGRLVQVSTDFVFDGRSSRPYLPGDHVHPLSVYGRSKAAGEEAAGPDAIVCRTSWIYAPGGTNFVRTMLRLMNEREELRVVDDQIGSPTSAAGLAVTLWGLAEKDRSGIYHHRDAGVASWYDFAVAIAEEALAIGLIERAPAILPIPTTDYPTPAMRPHFSVLDDRDTRLLLGDRPPHWRTALRTMLKEEKALD